MHHRQFHSIAISSKAGFVAALILLLSPALFIFAPAVFAQAGLSSSGDTHTLFDPVRLALTTSTVRESEQTLNNELTSARGRDDRAAEARTACDLGLIHMLQAKFSSAKKECTESLALRESAYGVNSNPCADSLNAMAAVDIAQGKYTEAEQELTSADLIEQRDREVNAIRLAETLDLRAANLVAQNRAGAALPLAEQAYALRCQYLGDTSPAAAQSLFTIGTAQLGLGKAKEALASFQQALEANDVQTTEPAASLACALVTLQMGQIDRSKQCFDRAVQSLSKLYGSTDDFVNGYRALYVKSAWEQHHFLFALSLRGSMPVEPKKPGSTQLDPQAHALVLAFHNAPASTFGFHYDHRYLIVCAVVALLAFALIGLMVVRPDAFPTMSVSAPDGLTNFPRTENEEQSQENFARATQNPTGEMRQPRKPTSAGGANSKDGKLSLKPDFDYIPKWNRDD